jgi:hypothetical protein
MAESEDPTQGGAGPGDDPTAEPGIGAGDDPTQGGAGPGDDPTAEPGVGAGDDPTQGGEVGERPGEDPTS